MVFLAYAMMPLKTWVAALFGLSLPVAHTAVATTFATEFPQLHWQQVGLIILVLYVLVLINTLESSGPDMI